MAVTPLLGWERVRKGEEEGSEGKRGEEKRRESRESGTPWSRKVVRRTELNLSATPSEMKGDFDNIISFNLSSFFVSFHPSAIYIVFMHLHSIWPPLPLLLFCSRSPVCIFFRKRKGGRETPHVVLLFIMKSAGVHQMTMEKLIFYLTHQEPVN